MKKLKITTIMFGFCLTKAFAQSACPSNGTHTDPSINPNTGTSYATPASGDFKQNTFDWTRTGWADYLKIINVLQPGYINSPYYSYNIYAPFASNSNSDFQATNGWELIKQDFGYCYGIQGNDMWDGYTMGLVPPNQYDPRESPSKINYYILYNKYTGLLRVFTYIPNPDPVHINTIYVKLAFLNASTDYANTPSYQPSVNALFSHYNPISCLALDQKTAVTVVSAPASFPSTSDMIYCDFQLAYDPCICLLQSGLEVSFYSIETANLTLSGTYAGTAIPLAAVNGNLGSIYGATTGDKFIASVNETNNTPQSAILSYENAANIVSQDAAEQAPLNSLAFGLGVASDVAEALGGVPVVGTVVGTIMKDALDAGSKVASFYSSQLAPSDAVKAAAAVTLQTGYMQATGTITYSPDTYEGDNFRIGVPGSKSANTLPEYAPAANGGEPLPNYPMYNEPTGTFNLLQTPQVAQYAYIPSLVEGTSPSTGFPSVWNPLFGTPGNLINHITFEYHPTTDLVYALNPIFDATKSTINIAYEIDGQPTPFVLGDPQFITYEFSKYSTNGLDFLYSTSPGDKPNSFERNRTKTFPIGCNQSIYSKEQFDFGDFTTGNTSDPNYFNHVNQPRRVTLVVMLSLVSNPDVYGKVHYTEQIIKYNCKVNSVTTDFEASGPGAAAIAAISNLPTDLTIPQTTYSIPTNTFSFGTITISGNQTDNAPNNGQVNIAAEQAINLSGANVSLTGNISLYLQDLPNSFTACSNTSIPPFSGSNLTAYCSSSGYNSGTSVLTYSANQNARTVASNAKITPSSSGSKTTGIPTKLGTNLTLGIFPNPTSGVVYLSLSTQNAGGLLVNISDLNGNQVMHSSFSANEGANSFKVDLSALNSGAYFINITYENGVTIKNDKLILMGQ